MYKRLWRIVAFPLVTATRLHRAIGCNSRRVYPTIIAGVAFRPSRFHGRLASSNVCCRRRCLCPFLHVYHPWPRLVAPTMDILPPPAALSETALSSQARAHSFRATPQGKDFQPPPSIVATCFASCPKNDWLLTASQYQLASPSEGAATTHPCQRPKRHSSQHSASLAPCTSRIQRAHP